MENIFLNRESPGLTRILQSISIIENRYRNSIYMRNLFQHLCSGFVRIHILYHASKEPIYGMEIMEELSHHGYDMSPGTLYPVLHQLEEQGYLVSNEKLVNGKNRKYYKITRPGKKLLQEMKEKLVELVDEVLEDQDKMKYSSH